MNGYHERKNLKNAQSVRVDTGKMSKFIEGIEKKDVEYLYTNKGLLQKDIAKLYNVHLDTIQDRFKRYKISTRIGGVMKYKKTNFSNDGCEKAYLMGFRDGDMAVRINGKQIQVYTNTTKMDMVNLFKKNFLKYGHPHCKNLNNKLYGDIFYNSVFLNTSFKFLLNKGRFFDEKFTNEEFYSYFAGYFDAEGCICISNKKCKLYRIAIQSQDKIILDNIFKQLKKDNFSPKLFLHIKAGIVPGKAPFNHPYKKDYFVLNINKQKEVKRILEILLNKCGHLSKINKSLEAINNINKKLDEIAKRTGKPILNACVFRKEDGSYDYTTVEFTGKT